MALVAFKGSEWFVVSDDCKHKLIGPLSKQDAKRFLLLMTMVKDGIAAIDTLLYPGENDEYAVVGAEQWYEDASELIDTLDDPVNNSKKAAILGIPTVKGVVIDLGVTSVEEKMRQLGASDDEEAKSRQIKEVMEALDEAGIYD